jgi:hypothetical protein
MSNFIVKVAHLTADVAAVIPSAMKSTLNELDALTLLFDPPDDVKERVFIWQNSYFARKIFTLEDIVSIPQRNSYAQDLEMVASQMTADSVNTIIKAAIDAIDPALLEKVKCPPKEFSAYNKTVFCFPNATIATKAGYNAKTDSWNKETFDLFVTERDNNIKAQRCAKFPGDAMCLKTAAAA